jgi:2-isopropylmalate synthase
MGYPLVSEHQLAQLTETAHFVAEIMNISPDTHAPFSGSSAFAHKGGLHSAAALKHRPAYEHVSPALVGNFSRIVLSELAGRAALQAKAAELGVSLPENGAELSQLLAQLKEREAEGYSYEVAEASLALYLAKRLNVAQEASECVEQGIEQRFEQCFELESFRVISEKRKADAAALAEATIKLSVDGERVVATGEGNGPVNALDKALRLAIRGFYPEIDDFELKDYKVRVLDESTGTSAVTRVLIDTGNEQESWGTVGVSENIIEASWDALVDAITYGLLRERG